MKSEENKFKMILPKFKNKNKFKILPPKFKNENKFKNQGNEEKNKIEFKKHSKRIKNSKLILDNRANVSIIITALLLISFLLLSIILLNTVIEEKDENTESIASNQYQFIIEDYKRNLPILEREALEEINEEVIKNKRPCLDSREDLKELIDLKLEKINEEYYNNYNIEIESSILGIENTSDPFSYKFKCHINSQKDEFFYQNTVEDNVNCYNLKDPVPLLFCGNGNGFEIRDNVVYYGNSLSEYLRKNNVENYSYYINASSPFIIKKCPYDPYKHHGDDNGLVMKNCRNNYYYHESADGACFLCRLEGKSGCNHYGFETFINPQKTNETGLVSACGSDHVIFSENIYPGVEVIFNREDEINEILFLDKNGHRVKYGMSGY
ncbi:hypothetical protein [uncultured Methanobrevibacter sp.]|uniref:hypothetical protein n=1 Tax=uncultured Methanobrevibacter sp. TaxID=253161 RepID=UPI002622BAA0